MGEHDASIEALSSHTVGKARCLVDSSLVAHFETGDFFGEMALLEAGGRRHAAVIAEEPSEVLVLDGREFNSLLDASPTIAKKLLVVLAERWREHASVRGWASLRVSVRGPHCYPEPSPGLS